LVNEIINFINLTAFKVYDINYVENNRSAIDLFE
jgi:hypothetical protein